MERYIIGILAIVGLMLTWVMVQQLWKRAFPDKHIDGDVLAGRSDCGNCGCTVSCSIKGIKKTKK